MTAAEKKELTKRAKKLGMNLSEYVRERAFAEKVEPEAIVHEGEIPLCGECQSEDAKTCWMCKKEIEKFQRRGVGYLPADKPPIPHEKYLTDTSRVERYYDLEGKLVVNNHG